MTGCLDQSEFFTYSNSVVDVDGTYQKIQNLKVLVTSLLKVTGAVDKNENSFVLVRGRLRE